MVIGFIGSGNMAAAMARGWAGADGGPERMLFTDSGSGRAAELAAEVNGEAMGSNSELAQSCDLVVLAVKPKALESVSAEVGGATPAVLSMLGATPLETLIAAFPGVPVFRIMPNLGVEVGRGVLCYTPAPGVPDDLEQQVSAALDLLGRVVEIEDGLIDAATAVMGCTPAYLALVVDAIAGAGAAAGLDPSLARSLVVDTTAGTAELLRRHEPAEVRRAVASPGGSTEAGLEALDREGAGRAFEAAVEASLARMRGEA
jgi:pyrroline-5-carboxylate reductase